MSGHMTKMSSMYLIQSMGMGVPFCNTDQEFLFLASHEQICKGWYTFCAHGHALFLSVRCPVEFEMVVFEYGICQVSCDLLVHVLWKRSHVVILQHSVRSLLLRYVCVEGFHVNCNQ